MKKQEIFKECLARVPEGPQQTRYNDWAEIVSECRQTAYYQAAGMKPEFEKTSKEVGDMCEQRDNLLEPGVRDKFDAFICIRPQE